jgi:predicted permease
LKGLHWDKIPGDNDDEVAARGILYLLIFQQLGQLVRWSWGYHVLLAPPESYEDSVSNIEGGRYRDEPELILGLDGEEEQEEQDEYQHGIGNGNGTRSTTSFESGGRTPITNNHYAGSVGSDQENEFTRKNINPTPPNGNILPDYSNGNITSFPSIRTSTSGDERDLPTGIRGIIPRARLHTKRAVALVGHKVKSVSQKAFHALPPPLQTLVTKAYLLFARFMHGLWEFMNPPLWAMLLAVIVASIPKLQRLFFEEGSFIANSVTRAVSQSGGVAVPLILVVLGANLARNTLPRESFDEDSEESQIGTKLMVASLISRMLLPTIIMAPMLALAAKHVPVSILDDPIFVIVCFLLTGAPSALQLAQICQINGVYEGVMSKLLFQSYVIWYVSISPAVHRNRANVRNRILPSTLILVMCALEVVEWAGL